MPTPTPSPAQARLLHTLARPDTYLVPARGGPHAFAIVGDDGSEIRMYADLRTIRACVRAKWLITKYTWRREWRATQDGRAAATRAK